MTFHLTSPFAADSAAHADDVRALKILLNRLGYYMPDFDIGISEFPDRKIFAALGQFQKDQDLRVTKSMKPGDDTEKALNTAQKKLKKSKDAYIWHTVDDDKVRPSHAAHEGKTFQWNKPPESGHPGDNINCRCWAEPVSDIEEEELPPPNTEEPKIPGTDIPDHGIPEEGWPRGDFDPYKQKPDENPDPRLDKKPPETPSRMPECPDMPWPIYEIEV